MTVPNELLDELLKGCERPEDRKHPIGTACQISA